MISRYTYHGLAWIDLESPTREEMLHLSEEFGLAKHIEEALFSESPLKTVEAYEHCISIHLPIPRISSNGTAVSVHPLTAIVGRKFLITAHAGSIEAIKAFGSLFEHVEKPEYHQIPTDGAMLFAELMKHVYAIALKDLSHISNRVRTIEHALLSSNTEQLLKGIFQTDRTLLSFKQSIDSHRPILEAYSAACMQCFREDALVIAGRISTEHEVACSKIEAEHLLLNSLQRANASHLTAKNNARLKSLIILSIIIILLTISTLLI